MKAKLNLNRWLLALDLAIVSVWAVFAIWGIDGMEMLAITFVAPVIILRITASFKLYFRERNALWVIGVLLLPLALFCIGAGRHCLDYLLLPFAKFTELVWRFFTENTSLTEGAYQYLTHSWEESMQKPCLLSWIVICSLSAWVYVVPVVWSIVLASTHQFIKVSWPWKRIIGYGGCYVIFVLVINFASKFFPIEGGIPTFLGISLSCVWFLGSIALAIPFTGIKGPRFHKIEMEYMMAMICVGLAIIIGLTTPEWWSLMVMLFSSCVMIWLIYQKWDGAKWDGTRWLYAAVIATDVMFWISQYLLDSTRFIIIISSIIFITVAATFYWKAKHKPIKTLWFVLSLGILIPFFSLGYNVLACSSAKRVEVFDMYRYSWKGIIIVERNHKIGLRDRYGYVMKSQYDSIACLSFNTPYCKVRENGLWGIYDMEGKSLVVPCEYLSIKPYKYECRVWQLESEYDGKTYFNYFKPYRFYGRFYPYNGTEISHEPMRHALKDFEVSYMPYSVENPKKLDHFFADMMNLLWNHADDASTALHYWKWAQQLSEEIDSLYEKERMFRCDSLDRYEAAMQQIEAFIDGGNTQHEMNNASYVSAICHNYMMHRKNIELAEELPDVDFFKEYRLFNEYQTYSENFWNEANNIICGHYSDRPREVNLEALYRFDERTEKVKEFLAVILEGKSIKAKGIRPSKDAIKKKFHELMPGVMRPIGVECEYPTDTIGTYFLKWIVYRDTIASQLPPQLATAYHNQTTNIFLDLIKPIDINFYEY